MPIAVTLALLAAPVSAALAGRAASARNSNRSVAVLPAVARGEVAPDILRALEAAIERDLSRAGTTASFSRNAQERLKGVGPVERCNGENACIGRLASTLHVDAVVFMMTEREKPNRVRCELRVIAAGGRVERRANIEVADAAAVDAALTPVLANLLGSIRPAGTAVAANDELELVPLTPAPATEAVPLAPVPPPSGETGSTAATAHPGTTGTASTTAGTATPATMTPSTTTAAPAGAGAASKAAVTPPSSNAGAAPQPAPARRHFIAYSGIGAAVVSLGLFGGGLYYHSAYERTIKKAYKTGPDGVLTESQPSAVRLIEQRDREFSRRNTLFALAGTAAVVASGLLALDLVWLNQPSTSVTVGVGPSHASAELTWRF